MRVSRITSFPFMTDVNGARVGRVRPVKYSSYVSRNIQCYRRTYVVQSIDIVTDSENSFEECTDGRRNLTFCGDNYVRANGTNLFEIKREKTIHTYVRGLFLHLYYCSRNRKHTKNKKIKLTTIQHRNPEQQCTWCKYYRCSSARQSRRYDIDELCVARCIDARGSITIY